MNNYNYYTDEYIKLILKERRYRKFKSTYNVTFNLFKVPKQALPVYIVLEVKAVFSL